MRAGASALDTSVRSYRTSAACTAYGARCMTASSASAVVTRSSGRFNVSGAIMVERVTAVGYHVDSFEVRYAGLYDLCTCS